MSDRESEVVRLDIPSNAKYLTLVSACIAELLARADNLVQRETVTYNIQLAAHETCTNIIDHAYAGNKQSRIMIHLALLEQPYRLVIDLFDTGRSFNLDLTPAPNLDQPQVHGYGLFIVRSLMDEVVYQPQMGNNHWCLIKHL